MKIGIVGNYGNDNNGDEAILLSIIKQVEQQFSISREDITVFSNNTKQTSEYYGVKSYPLYYKKGNQYKTFYATYLSNKRYINELDLLIIGGGGILMDFYRREAHLYSTYAFMAKNAKVPYIVYGCGAGPLDTVTGRLMIRLMCKHAENVSVRDPESKELLHQIGIKKEISVIGDPAFTLYKPKERHASSPKEVAVSAVPIYNANYWPSGDVEKYEKYVNSMAISLDLLIEKQDVNVTFFATKYPQDVDVTVDIQKMMKNKERTTIIDKNLKPKKLVDEISRFDLVIGTRLHSLIMATNSETPIIAISYHPKVTNFMKLIDAEDRCFSVDEIEKSSMILSTCFERVSSNWEDLVKETKIISEKLYETANKGKELMVKAVKDK